MSANHPNAVIVLAPPSSPGVAKTQRRSLVVGLNQSPYNTSEPMIGLASCYYLKRRAGASGR